MVFTTLAAIIVGVVVLEVLSAMSGPPPAGPAATSLSSTSTCTIAQPGLVFISVASDSNQTPVPAAIVTATNVPAYCGDYSANNQTTVTFVTDGDTTWYPLPGHDNEGYTFAVRYQGQTFGFDIVLEPLSTTCATLYVPSGMTNVTENSAPDCPLPTTATASSSQQSVSLTSEP